VPEVIEAIKPTLSSHFKPALLARMTTIPFLPISPDAMGMITRLKLNKLMKRLKTSHKATFAYAPEVVNTIARRCTEVDTGARNVDHILTRTLLPELSAEFLARMAEGKAVQGVTITVGGDETFRYEVV